jgi:hypothetical protein
MLISNPQHAVSLLQAHLALETLCPFRLIWRWKRLLYRGGWAAGHRAARSTPYHSEALPGRRRGAGADPSVARTLFGSNNGTVSRHKTGFGARTERRDQIEVGRLIDSGAPDRIKQALGTCEAYRRLPSIFETARSRPEHHIVFLTVYQGCPKTLTGTSARLHTVRSANVSQVNAPSRRPLTQFSNRPGYWIRRARDDSPSARSSLSDPAGRLIH